MSKSLAQRAWCSAKLSHAAVCVEGGESKEIAERGKVDSNQSFSTPTTGIGTVTGSGVTGTGIVPGVGDALFLQLEFGSTAMVTATPVDSSGTAQSATVTAVSYSGTPTETGAPSVNTAFPQPNGGGQQCSWPSKYSNGKDVTGVYPTSNVASISATAPFVVEANNNGEALVEFTAAGGRTGRLHVVVVNPVL